MLGDKGLMQEFYKLKKNSEKSQKTVYDVAIKYGGNVTVSDIYANSNLSVEEIEFILAELSSKNYVQSKMDEKTSVINYIFPDINKSEQKDLIVSTGLDKLILRIKYGNNNDKPVEYLEKAILQTAQECGGKLGIAKIIEYTGLNVTNAEDVIAILCAKGICKMEINSSNEIEYYFPEIINNPVIEDETIEKGLTGIGKNLSKKALKKIRKNTDRMIIKSKANKYKRKYKSSLFLDSFMPGMGHIADKRWGVTDLALLSVLPAVLSGGLSFIPSVALLRYQDASFYSLSQRDKLSKTRAVNKNSIFFMLVYSFMYYKLIGLHGLANYYLYLASFLGF